MAGTRDGMGSQTTSRSRRSKQATEYFTEKSIDDMDEIIKKRVELFRKLLLKLQHAIKKTKNRPTKSDEKEFNDMRTELNIVYSEYLVASEVKEDKIPLVDKLPKDTKYYQIVKAANETQGVKEVTAKKMDTFATVKDSLIGTRNAEEWKKLDLP